MEEIEISFADMDLPHTPTAVEKTKMLLDNDESLYDYFSEANGMFFRSIKDHPLLAELLCRYSKDEFFLYCLKSILSNDNLYNIHLKATRAETRGDYERQVNKEIYKFIFGNECYEFTLKEVVEKLIKAVSSHPDSDSLIERDLKNFRHLENPGRLKNASIDIGGIEISPKEFLEGSARWKDKNYTYQPDEVVMDFSLFSEKESEKEFKILRDRIIEEVTIKALLLYKEFLENRKSTQETSQAPKSQNVAPVIDLTPSLKLIENNIPTSYADIISDDPVKNDTRIPLIDKKYRKELIDYFSKLEGQHILSKKDIIYWICKDFQGFTPIKDERILHPKANVGVIIYFVRQFFMKYDGGNKNMSKYRKMLQKRISLCAGYDDKYLLAHFSDKQPQYYPTELVLE